MTMPISKQRVFDLIRAQGLNDAKFSSNVWLKQLAY